MEFRMLVKLKILMPERFKNWIYRYPRDQIKRLISLGILGYCFLNRWASQMERSVADLPSVPRHERTVSLWFLTGDRFWYQTAYCAWTFACHARRNVHLHLVDDGSLRPEQIVALERLFGIVTVYRSTDSREQLEHMLPADRYPVLRQRWSDYIHIRKLIDVHLGRSGPKLVLDSDMLFMAPPTALLDWLERDGERPLLHMQDCVESYGYSRPLLERLSGGVLPARLNVGICGLTSEQLNWDLLEHWSATLLAEEGTSYFLEQALVAMLAVQVPAHRVDAEQYITLPSPSQIHSGAGVLQHYVASSKAAYFRQAWRKARAQCL